MTTQEELNQYRIREITDAHRPLLVTVDWVDNSVDTWIECIDDNGEKVRLVPNMTGGQDCRREVMVMNYRSGQNRRLVYIRRGCGFSLRNATLGDKYAAEQVAAKIPAAVLRWAILRAH